MMLPAALQQWNNLRLSNFENVNAYNNQMQALVATIKACGQGGLVTDEDQIEKTISTIHAKQFHWTESLRRNKYEKYDLLFAEMRASEERYKVATNNTNAIPPGQASIKPQDGTPEVHYGESKGNRGRGRGNYYCKYRGRGREFGRGRGRRGPYGRGNNYRDKNKAMNNGRDESGKEKPDGNKETSQCHKCGLMGHWKRECKTPEFHCQM
jgi:hypothetical protein